MSTTEISQHAEDLVAKFMAKKGYKILANNWQGDYELMVASVGGNPPKIEQLIEL